MSWIQSFVFAFVIAIIIRTFLFSPVMVDGASMEPTLHNQEKMMVNKMVKWTGDIESGDIIVIESETEDLHYVKRVVGSPNDIIEMKDDQLFINEEPVSEPYLTDNKKRAHFQDSLLTENFGPIVIPDHHYFVMGDNRLRSLDSRNYLGFIHEDQIIGKTSFVYYPIKNWRVIE